MKPCIRCGNMLTTDATYCYNCNTSQSGTFDEFEPKPQYNDTFLKVLCILTLVATGISLLSLPFSIIVSAKYNTPVFLIVIGAIITLAKLIAAIMMLKKKRTGLYIYTVADVCSIFTTLYSTVTVPQIMDAGFATLGAIISIFFVLLFLILYWLPVNRRLLS